MKSMSKNMIVSILAKLIFMITGFVVQREILKHFGSDVNGLTSTVTQILSYMSLLEAGLGTASIQALYAPLTDSDWPSVNRILSATNKQYIKTGTMFLGLLVCVSLIVPVCVEGDIPQITMGVLTLLIGLSSVISYIFIGKYSVLLTADKKLYVISTIDIVTTVLSCLIRLIAMRLNRDIIVVQTFHLFMIIIKTIMIRIYVKSRYRKIDCTIAPDYRAISKRWSVLIHNIASMVVNHTDVVILSIAANLKTVSIYSVYNFVFNNLYVLMKTGFVNAPLAMFGQLYQRDEAEFSDKFRMFEILFNVICHTILFSSLVLILPFVTLYTEGVNDVNYIDPQLAVLFFVMSYLNIIRMPSLMLIDATGSFREMQAGAIVEAIINLVVSLLLLKPFGIYGLLVGTIISYLFRTPEVFCFVHGRILSRENLKFAIQIVCNLMVGLVTVMMHGTIRCDKDITWPMWIGYAVTVAIGYAVIFSVVNCLMNRKLVENMLKRVLKRNQTPS